MMRSGARSGKLAFAEARRQFYRMRKALLAFLVPLLAHAGGLDPDVKQLIVSIAPDWNADHGKLQLFEREGGEWKAASGAWPVLYGRKGLAWGRGLKGQDEAGAKKVERDK